ncbi:MAG: hypothetical protein HFF18_12680 [Oscillospiraceae bacterium]|nr:hypothetical protein [Oscillospiraceae bacterium]
MLKKLSAGAWISLIAAVLTLVSVILYTVNINSEGYFKNASVTNLTVYAILALILFLAAAALGQVKLSGGAATAVELLSGAMQIVAPVLLALCLISLIAARAEGLGFIYFSNADVILEVQTPANLASATGSIASMIALGVAIVIGLAGAFCPVRRKD